jgi:hypothetical protein
VGGRRFSKARGTFSGEGSFRGRCLCGRIRSGSSRGGVSLTGFWRAGRGISRLRRKAEPLAYHAPDENWDARSGVGRSGGLPGGLRTFFPRGGEGSASAALGGDSGANFGAPFFDFGFYGVADFAGSGEFFRVRPLEGGRVGETPMEAFGYTGEDGAALGAGFIADRDDIGEDPAGFKHVEDGPGRVGRNVDANFLHGLDDDGVEFAGFESGAMGFELIAADLVEEGLSHLAAGAIVDANKENSFLLHSFCPSI